MVFDGLEQVGLGTEHMALGVIVHCWDSGLRRQWVCSLNGLDETPLKEETIFIFRNELETYKALKVSKWVHCIYSKATDAGKMIKNVEFKTPNNEVLQETNLARLYDDMSEKIVKESEDFEGRDSGWTLDEILRLEVRTNRYSPFRGSSSFIEVPKHIAETKQSSMSSIKRTLSVSCGLFSQLFTPTPATPTKRQVMSPT
ncbi:hypothetical protein TNCV_99501 [Trichonephila clavipes]|nr:hypothetical protein TNCV_99501 [Trichonephila clavipes]